MENEKIYRPTWSIPSKTARSVRFLFEALMSLGRREVDGNHTGDFRTRTAILNFRSRQAFDGLGEQRLADL